jgi:hypothetical protein
MQQNNPRLLSLGAVANRHGNPFSRPIHHGEYIVIYRKRIGKKNYQLTGKAGQSRLNFLLSREVEDRSSDARFLERQ